MCAAYGTSRPDVVSIRGQYNGQSTVRLGLPQVRMSRQRRQVGQFKVISTAKLHVGLREQPALKLICNLRHGIIHGDCFPQLLISWGWDFIVEVLRDSMILFVLFQDGCR